MDYLVKTAKLRPLRFVGIQAATEAVVSRVVADVTFVEVVEIEARATYGILAADASWIAHLDKGATWETTAYPASLDAIAEQEDEGPGFLLEPTTERDGEDYPHLTESIRKSHETSKPATLADWEAAASKIGGRPELECGEAVNERVLMVHFAETESVRVMFIVKVDDSIYDLEEEERNKRIDEYLASGTDTASAWVHGDIDQGLALAAAIVERCGPQFVANDQGDEQSVVLQEGASLDAVRETLGL